MKQLLIPFLQMWLAYLTQDEQPSPTTPTQSPNNALIDPNNASMSANGRKVLQYWESCRLEAYWDATGKVWTIGWGDTGPDVVKGLVIAQAEADRRLTNRLKNEFEPGVLKALTQVPTQGMFDAMVDLAYNIGVSAFSNSTLVKLFNDKNEEGAAQQFQRWKYSNGEELHGLRRRRKSDECLFRGWDADEAIREGLTTP